MKSKLHFQVSGFEGCPYFEGAVGTLKMYKNGDASKTYDIKVNVNKISHDKWPGHLEKQCEVVLPSHKSRARSHTTSPFIVCNKHFIGGYDQLVLELQKKTAFKRYI